MKQIDTSKIITVPVSELYLVTPSNRGSQLVVTDVIVQADNKTIAETLTTYSCSYPWWYNNSAAESCTPLIFTSKDDALWFANNFKSNKSSYKVSSWVGNKGLEIIAYTDAFKGESGSVRLIPWYDKTYTPLDALNNGVLFYNQIATWTKAKSDKKLEYLEKTHPNIFTEVDDIPEMIEGFTVPVAACALYALTHGVTSEDIIGYNMFKDGRTEQCPAPIDQALRLITYAMTGKELRIMLNKVLTSPTQGADSKLSDLERPIYIPASKKSLIFKYYDMVKKQFPSTDSDVAYIVYDDVALKQVINKGEEKLTELPISRFEMSSQQHKGKYRKLSGLSITDLSNSNQKNIVSSILCQKSAASLKSRQLTWKELIASGQAPFEDLKHTEEYLKELQERLQQASKDFKKGIQKELITQLKTIQ